MPSQSKSTNFSEKINFLITNIRSLTKNSDALSLFIAGNSTDLICLSETWLKPSIDDLTALGSLASSHSILRCDRKRKKGGGVAIIYKKFLPMYQIFAETIPNGYEIVVGDIHFSVNKIRCISVYRTPSCEPILNYQLCKAISDLSNVPYECIVCGDFNLPQITWFPQPIFPDNTSKQLENSTVGLGFKQIVNAPTRGHNTLDLCFVPHAMSLENRKIKPPIGSSDHNTFTFIISESCPLNSSSISSRYDFKKADYPAIYSILSSFDWHGFFQPCENADKMYEKFKNFLKLIMHKYVPIVECSDSEIAYPQYLRNLSQQRERLWKQTEKLVDPAKMLRYKSLNEKFNKQLNKFLKNSEEKLLSKGGSKQLYQFIARKTTSKVQIKVIRDASGNLCSTPETCSDSLARHFAAVHKGSPVSMPPQTTGSLPEMQNCPYFTKDIILKNLKSCKKSFSETPDGIPSVFIVNIAPLLCAPLEIIYNNSLYSGNIPEIWKHAYVTPIPKKQGAVDVNQFRPISITCIFARIFEKLLKRSIYLHISDTGYISCNQHGFTKGKSVETQMLECLEVWTGILDKGGAVDVIYFDFSKAFDKVNHNLLMSKIKKAGMHPNICTWIGNYIKGRTFQVKVAKTYSKNYDIENGVPQGSCIAPTLFNLFTHELPDLLCENNVGCKMFADDTKIYREVSASGGTAELQAAIDKMVKWAHEWGLPLSLEKTQCLHLGTKNPMHQYTINNQPIDTATESVRDLGFLITKDLSLKAHAQKIVSRANLKTFNLFKNLKTRNKTTWMKIYKIYVRPILEFGPSVLNSDPTIGRILESAQNGFTRKVYLRTESLDYSQIPSAAERNRELQIDELKHRRNVADIKMISKLLAEESPLNKELFFSFAQSRTRGAPVKIKYPIAKKAIRRNSFSVRVGRIFIKLTKKHKIPKSNLAISKLLKNYS